MTTPVRDHADGVTVRIRVKPRAKRNRVSLGDGVLLVEVTAPPVEGAANAAVIAVLAEALGVKKRQIAILSGETGREKVVWIEGMTVQEIEEKIVSPPAL